MSGMEMKEALLLRRARRYYGKRYWYNTPGDGRVDIGVLQGLGGNVWLVGYIRESGATKRIKTARLQPMANPAELQILLDQWAHERQLEEVADV